MSDRSIPGGNRTVILAGFLIVQDPLLASGSFTLIIAGVMVAVGVYRIWMTFQHRGAPGWVWALFAGLLSILLGGIVIARWPVAGVRGVGHRAVRGH